MFGLQEHPTRSGCSGSWDSIQCDFHVHVPTKRSGWDIYAIGLAGRGWKIP